MSKLILFNKRDSITIRTRMNMFTPNLCIWASFQFRKLTSDINNQTKATCFPEGTKVAMNWNIWFLNFYWQTYKQASWYSKLLETKIWPFCVSENIVHVS
jgi:hypothetical protein